jgi:membrane fusion protein (multidrug efflux system)
VKAGHWYETFWIIDEGLKPGEKVVAEGTQKVKDGITVVPKPFNGEKLQEAEKAAPSDKGQSVPGKPNKR